MCIAIIIPKFHTVQAICIIIGLFTSKTQQDQTTKDIMPKDLSQERSITIISSILFGVSSLWIIRVIGKERERKRNSGQVFHQHYDDNNDSDDTNTTTTQVSRRCRRAISPATSYLEAFLNGLQYACDPIDRVDGFVLLCMAENKLAIDLLSERLLNPATTAAAFSDPIVYCYNSFLGLPVARQAASYFLAKRFLHTRSINTTTNDSTNNLVNDEGPTQESLQKQHVAAGAGVSLEQALQSINPAHIGIGSGAAGILNGLFYLLGDEGDCCLIPAPYYAAFENDMSVVAGIGKNFSPLSLFIYLVGLLLYLMFHFLFLNVPLSFLLLLFHRSSQSHLLFI